MTQFLLSSRKIMDVERRGLLKEFDDAWLNSEFIQNNFAGKKFYIFQSMFNDEVSVRIRTEIVEWLGALLIDSQDDADVILKVEGGLVDDDEGYEIKEDFHTVTISANTPVGALYGIYGLVRLTITNQKINEYYSGPSQSIRMINQWDQVDGTVERGYSGASILFGKPEQLENVDNGSFDLSDTGKDIFRKDYSRVTAYARMLASTGMNAISLNNVNVRGLATNLIVHPYLDGVAELANIFSSFGIKTYLAINWEAPMKIGGLTSSDPLAADVTDFWEKVVAEIYKTIPDFGGFVVKADSEGEPGPYAYGRTHADGANMLARVLAKFGGYVIWRAFVYNSKQDWRDRSTDRAKAAYENFAPLDGQFDENVALQVKFGPIDFQTSEPLNPLFGRLKKTNQIMEFEVTAEYLGQQIDTNYVLPQWLQMLNWDTQGKNNPADKATEILKTNSLNKRLTGFAAVGNVGMDSNWTGNKLAQANLYGFGRMCWNDNLTSKEILTEWIKMTFGTEQDVFDTVYSIMNSSNDTYKKYNAPLGVGFMVIPHYHYGVSVNGYEYDRWGTYHFADRNGVGVDRTIATGTGFTKMYPEKVQNMLENYQTTPEDLMLFFHHLSYDTVLPSGKTLIQTIYDQHFEGYQTVLDYQKMWNTLEGKIDNGAYQNVRDRLDSQVENALEWKDQVNTYFYRMSGVPDDQGRLIYE
jgi:alpha-glucuronidase